MPKSIPKELKKYKEYVRERLAKLTPILEKAAVGDFSKTIEIPKKEDEFSELLVGLSLMISDLQELKSTQAKVEEERKRRLGELEQWRKLTIGRELKMIELKKEVDQLRAALQKIKGKQKES